MRTPESVEKFLAEDELKLYRLIWMRFVASQMTPAVFDQTTIDVDAKGKDGAAYLFRATGSVPKFDGFLKVYRGRQGREGRRRRGAEEQAPGRDAGRDAEVQGDPAGAAFHRAAAALHGSDAGEGARSRRRGPPVHLRVDSFDHPGARVRSQGRRQVHAHRARHGGDRSAARKLRRSVRRHLHGAHGRPSWTRSKKASSTGAWP